MSQSQGTGLNHYEIVRRLNSIQGKTWTAKVPSFMSTMTLEKMNKRAGIRQNRPTFVFDKATGSFVQKASLRGNKSGTDYSHFSREDVSHLPKEFSHEQYLHPVRSQEDCGSCYALATTAMLSSRLWLKYGDSTQLSPQHSLSCNYYNQGCDGGYGFLVSKFYSEFEAVPESCHPYQATDDVCSRCNVESLSNVYTVTDYEYIGGSYGKSSERLMMEEIKKNGPIVVSFEPKMDFMYYNGGVYHSVEINQWIEKDEQKPSWQKVDHSVLCYGWGEDEEHGKYWLLQNSWGPEWGEFGNFKMRRGTDESNIESMGERANIEKKSRRSANTTMFASTYSSHQDKYYSAFLQSSKPTQNKQKTEQTFKKTY